MVFIKMRYINYMVHIVITPKNPINKQDSELQLIGKDLGHHFEPRENFLCHVG
jgi:hypothetical protein